VAGDLTQIKIRRTVCILGETFNPFTPPLPSASHLVFAEGSSMIGLTPFALLSTILTILLPLAGEPANLTNRDFAATPTTNGEALKKFAAIHPIDAHVHVFRTAPEFQKMLEEEQLTLLNILVVDDTWGPRKKLQPQIDAAWRLVDVSRGHVKLCTTFDPYQFNSPKFPAESIRQVDRDFHRGAIAMKIWKNVGMEVKDNQGKYVLPDDPKLQPIFEAIARQDKTLLTHLAEPDLAWQALDVKKDPLSAYYLDNPQWHMLNKPGVPSKRAILEARDHILERNPQLRVVGVHLGSMEKDLDDLARHLDRYPNFAVDTAARMEYFEFGNREKVRAFLIKYQDRVIYGTDLDVNPDANVQQSVQEWKDMYACDWRFLATNETLQIDGRTVHGVDLPQEVLQKIYRTNAQHWIKGL
jgi:predicted TIM-barrel fold metal-dependent hydrolase